MPKFRSPIKASIVQHPSQRIQILFLIPSFKTGGAEIQLLSLVRGLDKSLFSITVAAFYKGNELDRLYENIPGIRVVYLHKGSVLNLSFLVRLLRLMRQHKFHIVQSYNISARLFGTISAKWTHVPVSIVTERTARLLHSSFGSRLYLFFEKFAMRYTDLLIANSEAGREFAVSRGIKRDRTRVIYNGIDPERLRVTRERLAVRADFSIPPGAFFVGMIARIEPLKDPLVFIKAARTLVGKYDNIYFMLVGDGSMLDDAKKSILRFNLTGRMIVTGYRSDTANLLNAIDAFVLTSKEVEGCSNAILEALCFGKPVVATKVGGNAELVEHEKNGLLITPSDPAGLVEALLRLYRDNDFRHTLSINAKKSAEKFTQTAMVSAHEKLYVGMIERWRQRQDA